MHENIAYVLIDFDNYFSLETEFLDEKSLEFELKDIFTDAINSFGSIESIYFRLYGGWLRDFIPTIRASKIVQLLSNINIFPYIKEKRIVKGNIELANTILNVPDITWGNTLTERNGVPRMRINHNALDSNCTANSLNCPPSILYRFTRHKGKTCGVSGCTKIQRDVFTAIEQKMVDTMLACDIISISKEDGVIGLYLISDDCDHLPSIALASTNKNNSELKIKVGIKNEKILTNFESLLHGLEVEIKLYE